MIRKTKFWVLFLLGCLLAYILWLCCCSDPCRCKRFFNKIPEASNCTNYKVIRYKATIVRNDKNGEFVLDTIDRTDTIRYICNEWLLDGTNPTAEASRDSLRKWGFCIVRACPCPDSLELWRYAGDKIVQGIDDTGGGEVVVDPKKKGTGIGGLELNYVISFAPPDSTRIVDNKSQSPNEAYPDCGAQSVKIAIVDSGVDPTNSHLLGSAWNPIPTPLPPCDNPALNSLYGLNILGSSASWEPMDDHGHGTHINGIVSGVAQSGGNRMGVPFEFINVKILGSDNSCTLFDAMCGLYYALNQGAEVINISWGFKDTLAPTEIFAPFFKAAKAQGVVLVAGMGNDSINVDDKMKFWPACFAKDLTNMVSVSAINSATGGLASFSNWSSSGLYMSVAAPGKRIVSSYPTTVGGVTTTGLASMSGTSMATPFVTRTAAVLIGQIKASVGSYTADEIKTAIVSTATSGPPRVHRMLNHGGNSSCICAQPPCLDCGAIQCPPLIMDQK